MALLPPIIIDDVRPSTPAGFPAKAVAGQPVPVSAVLVADGHDLLGARVRWRRQGSRTWNVAPLVDDPARQRWVGTITPTEIGPHQLVVDAWTDRYRTWVHEIEVKVEAGVDVELELEEGARILEDLAPGAGRDGGRVVREAAAALRRRDDSLEVRLAAALSPQVADLVAGIPDTRRSSSPTKALWVDRPLAAHAAWYEMFPRSFGGFRGAMAHLDYIADLGFDVVYLPPIHPIGRTHRKGPNNTLVAGPDDPGSPWAIGAEEGGHDAIHPDLGTMEDFEAFVARAAELGLEVALDYALQCSPDHPWVNEHPEWFEIRPDGSIRYAENPPKKYQDIHPISFWPKEEADRVALWEACRDIVRHWMAHGIRTFRVDNPHTKPVAFWAWLIEDIHRTDPDVVFLAEAFTTPQMMAKLAEVGFTQSYTYFTWRHEPWELREYVTELTTEPLVDYMRPSFWPNTPDILDERLRYAPPSHFALRFVLAATLVPIYGIYSGYELVENVPASEHNTEYLDSEKYQIKERDWSDPPLAPLIRTVNEVRRRHPDVWALRDVRFHHSDNEQLLVYSRGHVARDLLLVVVNLDPHHAQETTVRLDLGALGLPPDQPYTVHDELGGGTWEWRGPDAYVRLDPAQGQVAHLFHVTLGGAPQP
ncbi:MAG TPA: alpha-1,4-glucan--maltose-1-phosphate maltosyltransferase [Acidimicrobiales bacterium]|nr:alpha-1,4-glucan--maltose-1-phosphate maltosyltransferase [Acidimicrobiales bacterium]